MFSTFKRYLRRFYEQKSNSSINDILRPMSYVIILFGLTPYSLRYDEREQNFTIVKNKSKKRLFWSMCHVTFITVLYFNLTYVYFFTDLFHVDYDFFRYFTYFLQGILGYSSCLTYYVEVCIHRRAGVAMLQALCEAWRAASAQASGAGRAAPARGSEAPGRMLLSVYVVLGLLVLINTLRFWMWIGLGPFNSPYAVLKYLPIHLETLSFAIVAHIYVYMLLVVTTLIIIKENVLSVARGNDVTANFSDVMRTRCVVDALKRLRCAYGHMHVCVTHLNRGFQGTIILLLMQAFVNSLTIFHLFFQDVIYNVMTWDNRLFTILWVIFVLLKVFVFAHASQLIEKESMKVGQALHKIPTNTNGLFVLLQIQHFAKDMRYRTMRISLFGYFPLRSNVLYNIIAALMSYFIVIVQFDLMLIRQRARARTEEAIANVTASLNVTI